MENIEKTTAVVSRCFVLINFHNVSQSQLVLCTAYKTLDDNEDTFYMCVNRKSMLTSEIGKKK